MMDTTNDMLNETAAIQGARAVTLAAEWAAEWAAAEPERAAEAQAEIWLAQWEEHVHAIIQELRFEGADAADIADAEWVLAATIARRAQIKAAAENASRVADLLTRFQDLQPFQRFLARVA